MKFDLNDQIETKSDQMQRNFDTEIVTIKEKYNSAVELVTEASKNLGGLFTAKMVKVKTRIAKFFADTDIKVNSMNEDLVKMGNILFDVQKIVTTPTMKYEAQVFAL